MNGDGALPLEDFIQAITSQLDRTQLSMALKAKAGMPLTFAVKDLTLDLRAHLDMSAGAVTIRPAGPGDPDASRLHLELTTITRPMIEENTRDLSADAGAPSIKEVLGDDLSDEDERRLEWAGIQNIAQLRQVDRSGGDRLVQRLAPRPVDKLRQALEASSRPRVDVVERVQPRPIAPVERAVAPGSAGPVGVPRLRIRGENLRGSHGNPIVRLAGEQVPVIEVGDDALLVQPLSHHDGGHLEIETVDGTVSAEVPPSGDETPKAGS
jgi:hypothetical protein